MGSCADQPHADGLQLAYEKQRLTELFKYFLSTSRAVHRNAVNIDSTEKYQPAAARISADPALNAFSQLGCLRLKCDRAFISLIDDKNQHIVAEATQSISLYDQEQHALGDNLALGEMPLDLFAGVCAGTIKVFTSQDDRYNESTANIFADRSRYVINDFTLEEMYKDRPYVKEFPYMRYYAEVPLITPGGYVIGSFCVVDNKPRRGLSDQGFRILQEIASTIMRHLGLVKTDYEHSRAGYLLDGLNSFVQGEATTLELSNTKEKVTVGNAVESSHQLQRRGHAPWPVTRSSNSFSSNSELTGGSEVLGHRRSSTMTTPDSLMERKGDVAENPIYETSSQRGECLEASSEQTIRTSLHRASTEDQIGANFQRASCILRQAMDLDGVVFLGAPPNTFDSAPQHRIARTLGYSVREKSELTSDAASLSRLSVPESLHQVLLARYPRGHVFAFDAEGFVLTSTRLREYTDVSGDAEHRAKRAETRSESQMNNGHEIDSVIQSHFPAACSMIFMPLWNPHKSQWFAGCVGWTANAKRILSSKEFGYFSAFGNSVMAEVSRLELLATDLAKSDFISSISHELRSPLHGILGSTELLRGMKPSNDQRQMIEMIETCGRTLLDTMEHILDYSKINSLTSGKLIAHKADPALHGDEPDASVTHNWSDFDLSMLVEDTVEGSMAGYRFDIRSSSQLNTSHFPENEGSAAPGEDLDTASGPKQYPDVILDIEHCSSWSIKSDVGAWRRILLNLFGNALKYTSSGFIEVALHSKPGTISNLGKPKTVVSLSVRDTGRGISPDYLQNHLYKPFMQEDALSVGAGLGLSIVHKLVGSLGGHISIESGLGSGTQVTITVPVTVTKGQPATIERLSRWSENRRLCLLNSTSRTQSETTPQGSLSRASKSVDAFANAFTAQAEQWFDLNVFSTQSITSMTADVVVIPESELYLLEGNDDSGTASLQVSSESLIIAICSSITDELHSKSHGTRRIQCLTQPVGPRKLARVLAAWFREPERKSATLREDLTRRQGIIDNFIGPSQAKCNPERKSTTPPGPRAVLDCSEINPNDAAAYKSSLPERLKELKKSLNQDASNPAGLSSRSAGRSQRLLLVDDNYINLRVLVAYMKRFGWTYATATNGQQALEKYQQSEETFDYVLMDVSMPIMNGFESARHIRAFEQEKGMTPSKIIALTGLATAEAQREALRSGFDLFLPKPVPMQKLKTIIEQFSR